ncbi:hypothetical protein T484DRAFT_1848941, partial [Baffinella frigidus]
AVPVKHLCAGGEEAHDAAVPVKRLCAGAEEANDAAVPVKHLCAGEEAHDAHLCAGEEAHDAVFDFSGVYVAVAGAGVYVAVAGAGGGIKAFHTKTWSQVLYLHPQP